MNIPDGIDEELPFNFSHVKEISSWLTKREADRKADLREEVRHAEEKKSAYSVEKKITRSITRM